MDIRFELQKEHAKENTENIVRYVQSSDERLAELMEIFLHERWELVQRAAWVVGKLGEQKGLLDNYLPQMISKLHEPNIHDAVKRNTVRTWQLMEIPEHYIGEVADICFNYLEKKQEPVAVKVFSMVVLEKVVRRVPELKDELKFLIEEQMPYGTPGFVSRGRKVLAGIANL